MYNLIQEVVNSEAKVALRQLLSALRASDKRYFLRNEILQAFANYCSQFQKPTHFYHSSALGKLIHYTHELILEDESIWLLLRPWVGSQQVWQLAANLSHGEPRAPQALLEVTPTPSELLPTPNLEVDFGPFYESSPSISDPKTLVKV